MGRILAIDYGTKRVGLAVTDELQISANRLETVSTDRIIEYLQTYNSAENVETIVLGYPLHLDGKETEMGILVKEFAAKLQRIFPNIAIELLDERFTSKIASRTIAISGLKKKKRQDKGLIDGVSATILLQDYLLVNR